MVIKFDIIYPRLFLCKNPALKFKPKTKEKPKELFLTEFTKIHVKHFFFKYFFICKPIFIFDKKNIFYWISIYFILQFSIFFSEVRFSYLFVYLFVYFFVYSSMIFLSFGFEELLPRITFGEEEKMIRFICRILSGVCRICI